MSGVAPRAGGTAGPVIEIGGAREEPASERVSFAVLLLVLGLLSFTGVFNHSLWTPDEPRVAEIGRGMLVTGDYLVPRIAGEPFLEKPPLYWWTQVAAYRLFGVSEGVARLPGALFAFATALLAYDMARRIAGARAGFLAACVLVTFAGFSSMHRIVTDPALAFFIGLGFWSFQRAAFPLRGQEQGRRSSTPWILLFHAAGGLAFLSKGIVALGLLFGPVGLYLLFTRRRSLLLHWAHVPGLVLLAALCAIWPLLLYHRGGWELLDGFLVDNVLNRFLGAGSGGHERPATFYLIKTPIVLLPWVVALPALYRHLLQARGTPGALPPGLGFMASVLPVGILLLSLPATKRPLYTLPLLAPMAVALGVWLTMHERDPGLWVRNTLRILFGLALLVLSGITVTGAALLASRAGLPLASSASAVIASPAAPYLGAVQLLVGGGALFALARRGRRKGATLGGITMAFCLVWLLIHVTGYRLIDPAKDLRPTMTELAAGQTLDGAIGYRLDETTRAALPFYTGRSLVNFEQADAVVAYLRKNPSARVLMLGRRSRRLPAELADRFTTISRWDVSGHRAYVLFELASPLPADASGH